MDKYREVSFTNQCNERISTIGESRNGGARAVKRGILLDFC
jgi:hypothetical protein